MHDLEMVIIWFWSVIAGVILTMLMPQMVSTSNRRVRLQHEWTDVPARDEFEGQNGAVVLMEKEPAVYLVSTSWAWDTPRVTSEREASGPPRAA
mgnify:CR=1 FL=1